jgi:hypothetical protein
VVGPANPASVQADGAFVDPKGSTWHEGLYILVLYPLDRSFVLNSPSLLEYHSMFYSANLKSFIIQRITQS